MQGMTPGVAARHMNIEQFRDDKTPEYAHIRVEQLNGKSTRNSPVNTRHTFSSTPYSSGHAEFLKRKRKVAATEQPSHFRVPDSPFPMQCHL